MPAPAAGAPAVPAAGGRIVVVDYHKGNLSSVERGLAEAGGAAVVSDDPATIRAAAGVVLPGVGSFGDAMEFLRESGEAEALLDAVGRGVPFLGICLGLQLLFERGNETGDGSWARGLGVLAGSATRLESTRLKVPHVGWDQIDLTAHGRACPLFEGVAQGANVYFTHSYALADDVDVAVVAARTHYVRSFASAVWDGGSVFGVQFHPEKSSAVGGRILANFVRVVGDAARRTGEAA
ncbi:imidazole glycerol phosphate synthase subunit HisH [Olsenella profusa]|uniref:Imidazole glycerol phosphate synthase subunit HisH n=2 Tax=Olsenella profusa TaxID=138595 RepID=A0ABS2F2X9_9ACTN|nr:imidazole glycerol phosphate synthase subunit HisH [Olsenella profusa]